MTDESHMMLSRRSLLVGAGSWAIGSLLGGCSSQTAATLQLLLLRGSIPQQFIGQFQQTLKQLNQEAVNLKVDTRQQLEALFTQLQTWKQSPPGKTPPSGWDAIPGWVPFIGRTPQTVPDLLTLGDFWLETAIRQNLITPLDPKALPAWDTLAKMPQFKQLVTRGDRGQLDPNGQIWAVPYRFGTTVIAYRRDIFEQRNLQPPTDWGDLWRADLRRRIGLLDNPREVIGFTLKKLKQSYNTPDLATVANLKAELQSLNQQAKYYSSTHYLQPLILDDVWLTVGWSEDVLSLSQRNRQIEVVIPRSGTALSADLWVHPQMGNTALPAAAHQWINYCWDREPALQLTQSTWAASPVLVGTPTNQLPQRFQEYPALLPDAATFQQSEFLLPIATSTAQQYRDLWSEMRQG